MNDINAWTPPEKMEVTRICPICAKLRKWEEMTFSSITVHGTHGIQNAVICLCHTCKIKSFSKPESVPDPQNCEGVKSASMNQNYEEGQSGQSDYRGMEYPLERLPEIWDKLAHELSAHAAEATKGGDHGLARTFSHRSISILACAAQLKWSLAHRAIIHDSNKSGER